MKWILLIWVAGGYNQNTPAVMSADFENKAACLSAYAMFTKEIYTSDRKPSAMRGVCVPEYK